jgi:hypothetical protein
VRLAVALKVTQSPIRSEVIEVQQAALGIRLNDGHIEVDEV